MEPSLNPVSLLSRGTMVTWAAFSAVIVLILLLATITVIVARKVRRKASRI